MIFILAVILLGFPRELPGARETRDEQIKEGNIRKSKNTAKPSLKMILPELRNLLTNWTFLFNSLGLTATLLYAGGLIPFYPKILQLKFGLLPENTGYLLGAILTPSMAGKERLGDQVV